MSSRRFRIMGQSNTKLAAATEARFDKAVEGLDLLKKTGKERANDIIDVFRHMENYILTLKSEKEFLSRQLQRMETRSTQLNSKERKIILYEVDTQTEKDDEMTLSIENETLRTRNQELEQEILSLKELVKQEGVQHSGKIIPKLACSVLMSQPEGDKYTPISNKPQEFCQLTKCEYASLLNDKDIMNEEIRKLGELLCQERKDHEHTKSLLMNSEKQICQKNELSDKESGDTSKLKNENDILRGTLATHEDTIKNFKNAMREKIDRIQEQENKISELNHVMEQNSRILNDNSSELQVLEKRVKDLTFQNQQLQEKLKENEKQLKYSEDNINDVIGKLDISNHELTEKNREIQSLMNKISTFENCIKDKCENIKELEKKLNSRETSTKEMKMEIENVRSKLKQQSDELTDFQIQMESTTKKLRNELSLEAVNLQNEKKKNEELISTITKLEEENSDILMTNNRIETDLEIKEEERCGLQKTIEELKNKEISVLKQIDALVQENDTLKKEREQLRQQTRIKMPISFHSVLKQPQSDQAVSGITALLQQELRDVELDLVPESRRSKNIPLLVVLYNLSRLMDDVRGALSGVEASSDVALVVLHSKEVKKPSEKLLTEPEFKKLGIIVDMSFLSAKGIIENDVTSNAINQLVGFINRS